ncbi:hypothetical protein Tco_0648224 [Tanacetum coccineum]
MTISLKWIFKVKLDEYGEVLKNKARLVAKEYGSLSDGCEDATSERDFKGRGIPLCSDSQSAIALSCNTLQHSRTKHITVRYYFIEEQVKNKVVELYFVKIDYQLADIFTKAIARERFEFLINHLGMQSITPEELKCLAESDEE